MNGLTKRQKSILDFVASYQMQNGIAPTYREIARHFRLSSVSTVHQHIQALVDKGFLEKDAGHARSLGVLEGIDEYAGVINLPLVGLITAGEPIEAIEERETIAVP